MTQASINENGASFEAPGTSAAAAAVVVVAAAAAVVVAVAAATAVAETAAAEEDDDKDNDPETTVVTTVAEHIDSLSPRFMIFALPAPRGGRQKYASLCVGAAGLARLTPSYARRFFRDTGDDILFRPDVFSQGGQIWLEILIK